MNRRFDSLIVVSGVENQRAPPFSIHGDGLKPTWGGGWPSCKVTRTCVFVGAQLGEVGSMVHSRYRRARTPPELWDARPLSLQVIFMVKSAPEARSGGYPTCAVLSTARGGALRGVRGEAGERRVAAGGAGAGLARFRTKRTGRNGQANGGRGLDGAPKSAPPHACHGRASGPAGLYWKHATGETHGAGKGFAYGKAARDNRA